jgi:hypothetical protein
MTTITIPKNFTSNEELIAIPRKEYENLLRAKNKKELDLEIIEALDDVKMGRVIGPFSSLSAGLKALKMAK